MKLNNNYNGSFLFMIGIILTLITGVASAQDLDLGTMATTITGSFEGVTKLITASSYLAGLGFAIGSIMKFKQHKDNPSNIPIGTPIALLFIAAALLFLPTILDIAGQTMFGSEGTTASPTGTIYGQ